MAKVIYRQKPGPRPRSKEQFPRQRGKRGWLSELLDPDGENPLDNRPEKSEQRLKRIKDRNTQLRKSILNPRKLKQWERLDWVADKLIKSWTHRKIVLEFAKLFNMGKRSAENYIERIYKDFQNQYTDPSRRNVLLAEFAASLKEGMRTALVSEDLAAYNSLCRQYGEVMGILTPAHLLKFHMEDNRQQVMVHSIEEAKATLSALEKLSEQDLFSKAVDAKIIQEVAPEDALSEAEGS